MIIQIDDQILHSRESGEIQVVRSDPAGVNNQFKNLNLDVTVVAQSRSSILDEW